MNGVYELNFKNSNKKIFENETGINIETMDLSYSKSFSTGRYCLKIIPKNNNPRKAAFVIIPKQTKAKDLNKKLKRIIIEQKLKEFNKKATVL